MADSSSKNQYKEKPKICAIDLDKEIIEAIETKGLHCFKGTLGSMVKVPNLSQYDKHPCLLNYNFPANLHEYDIVIVDLQSKEPIEYIESDHNYSLIKGSQQKVLLCSYPETLFDSRPLAAGILWEQLKGLLKKDTLVIAFSSSNEIVEYNSVLITDRGYELYDVFKKDLYSLLPLGQNGKSKTGKNTRISSEISGIIGNFIQKYNNQFIYTYTFDHPVQYVPNEESRYSARKVVKRSSFIPLIFNLDNEIVGFVDFLYEPSAIFVFPQLEDKKSFVLEFINNTLPEVFPRVFPFSEQFSWLKSQRYFLPNHSSLLKERINLEEEYKLALNEIEDKIEQNKIKYRFLHSLMTETDDVLVKSVEKLFSWLEFENIINMDETKPEVKEEDLQITLDDGLLVVEVKGIGGTSKDSDCSQISKIRRRREKERNKFDVFALYIVNHQRYLPPHERKNPPFGEHQINDAKSDDRGLLTTYQLFDLYSNIEQSFITKKDARASLLQYGLVKFEPSNSTCLGVPLEIHHKGQVVILHIENILLCKSASIIVCDRDSWFEVEILEIQLNGKPIDSVSDGEIGIKLSHSVSKKSELWLRSEEYQ